MAAGLPCISTDCPCGGPEALIRSGENGILVPVGDETALAEALERLLSNRGFAEKLGEQAKKDAVQYAPDAIFEQWKDFVDRVML